MGKNESRRETKEASFSSVRAFGRWKFVGLRDESYNTFIAPTIFPSLIFISPPRFRFGWMIRSWEKFNERINIIRNEASFTYSEESYSGTRGRTSAREICRAVMRNNG